MSIKIWHLSILFSGIILCSLRSQSSVVAQNAQFPTPPAGDLTPRRPDLLPLPEQLPSTDIPPQITAPSPSNIPPASEPTPPASVKVLVKQVKVLGNTVFSDAEIAKAIAPFVGQEATFEQLLEIRTAITNLYTSNGFTTSGAFLPPQDVSTGLIQVQVVEGEIERLEIQGLQHLRDRYVRDRIHLSTQTPVSIPRLETALQLLQIDPLISNVQAELKAGTSPGRSVLVITLKEENPLRAELFVENRDSPSVGAVSYGANIGTLNLLGFGDRLNANVGFTSGIQSYDINYEFPVNAHNGTFNLRYANDRSRIIEVPFSSLDINGRTQTISFGFRQPLQRSPHGEFALSLGLDLRESQTYILGNVPFSFPQGGEDGRSQVTVIRFSQDWINRSSDLVLAARSQFSLGIGALGATVNDTGTDGRFFSWLGQFQLVKSLGESSIFIARIAAQLTGNSLLSLEQFSIGGVESVRGYRQNRLVGDNGIVGSLETRFPILRGDLYGNGLLQITPFFDIGTIWNNGGAVLTPSTLYSIGLGLRYQIGSSIFARIDYGIPLNRTNQAGNAVEDSGLFFSLRMQL